MEVKKYSGAAVLDTPRAMTWKDESPMCLKHTPVQNSSQEQWRPVPGYPAYEVSSHGQFRRVHAKQAWRIGRLIKVQLRKDGYCTVGLWRDGKQVTEYAHRLVCEAFHGPPPGRNYQASHENGRPADNRPSNLSWKPPAANLEDKRRHGTHGAGEKHGGAVITDATVTRIFELRASGMTLKEIAHQTGIHFSHVSDILRRKAWSHVSVPVELEAAAQAADGRRGAA